MNVDICTYGVEQAESRCWVVILVIYMLDISVHISDHIEVFPRLPLNSIRPSRLEQYSNWAMTSSSYIVPVYY